jgi:hypothetical protein
LEVRKKSMMRNFARFLTVIVCCSAVALAADTITGVARNQTTGKFAAGDEVVLLCLDHSMQDESRTKTDAHGGFSLPVRYPDKAHLVRVLHQGVNYDQRASAGEVVSVDVFDSAPEVADVTGSIEIIRAGTNGNSLHLSDMIEIRNDSRPPLTQAGKRTFEVYLPPAAKIDSVLAAGAGKIGVMISATPLTREPGHYTVNFPLRPGSTKFAFNYDLPYDDGHVALRTWSRYPLQQLAVMLPPSMKFTSESNAFQVLPAGNADYRVEAANQVSAGEGPGFELSGVGLIPSVGVQTSSKPAPVAIPAPATSTPAHSPAVKDENASPPSITAPTTRGQWWVLGLVSVVIGLYGFLLHRREKLHTAENRRILRTALPNLKIRAELLQEELSRLEIERSQGVISASEYISARQALEGTVRRAIARAAQRP